MTPFWIQIPKSAMNPTPADIPKLIPVKCKARMPPINANGTLAITSDASLMFPNMMNSSRKMAIRLIGTTFINLSVART